MIRLPDIPNLQPADPRPASPSPGAVAAPARALDDVSRGLATTGQALQSEALRIQKIENARRESEIRQGWQQSLAELNQRLATETDPTRIPQLTLDLLANLSNTVEDDSLPPALRDRLRDQYLNFSTQATIRAGEQASRLAITRAQQAFENETQAAIRSHDRDGLEAAISTASDAFGLLPEQADSIRQDFDRSLELDLLDLHATEFPDRILESSPEQFRETYPHLTRADHRRAQSAARREIQNQRTSQIDSLTEALDQGTLTEDQIEAADRLTANDKRRLKSAIARDAPREFDIPLHEETWNKMFDLRALYDDPEITDHEYMVRYNDLRAEVLSTIPDSERGPFNQELSFRSPANRRGGRGAPGKNLPINQSNLSDANALISELNTKHKVFGEDPMHVVRVNQLRRDVEQLIAKNPGADFEETILPFILKRVGLSAAAAMEFLPQPPPPIDDPLDPARVDELIDQFGNPTPGILPAIQD